MRRHLLLAVASVATLAAPGFAQQAAETAATLPPAAGGADIHVCATPLPIPPHGPGVVVNGSQTVLINNLAACRAGACSWQATDPSTCNLRPNCWAVAPKWWPWPRRAAAASAAGD